jgi:Flp pilus assembly pilin Flp
MEDEHGQTTIEYVLVLVIVVLVIFFALRTSAINEAIVEASGKIANKILEVAAP